MTAAGSTGARRDGANRIDAAFARLREQGRTGLIPYVTAGDPSPAASVPLMHALVASGADVIELGVPFSDPMADGPVIQAAAERALAQGTSLSRVLEMVGEFRRRDTATPVVLMGYANPVEAMGVEAFAERAAAAGVDGVLVVDYPPEEAQGYASALDRRGLAPIFLLAPTTPEARIRAVSGLARGYVYYVSLRGVTGAGHLDVADVAGHLATIRRLVAIPVGVGFGIRDAETAQAIAAIADAVVIGSRLIEEMQAAGPDAAVARAAQWLLGIRRAIDRTGRRAA